MISALNNSITIFAQVHNESGLAFDIINEGVYSSETTEDEPHWLLDDEIQLRRKMLGFISKRLISKEKYFYWNNTNKYNKLIQIFRNEIFTSLTEVCKKGKKK